MGDLCQRLSHALLRRPGVVRSEQPPPFPPFPPSPHTQPSLATTTPLSTPPGTVGCSPPPQAPRPDERYVTTFRALQVTTVTHMQTDSGRFCTRTRTNPISPGSFVSCQTASDRANPDPSTQIPKCTLHTHYPTLYCPHLAP